MRKILFIAIFALIYSMGMAQDKCFWVFFTDKNDTQFDPYSYFDAKAIERYQQCGADLYDISNYPLNDSYVNSVCAYSTEVFGESRWLNALGVMASDDNAALIAQMPFVAKVQEIVSDGTLASLQEGTTKQSTLDDSGLLRYVRNDECPLSSFVSRLSSEPKSV